MKPVLTFNVKGALSRHYPIAFLVDITSYGVSVPYAGCLRLFRRLTFFSLGLVMAGFAWGFFVEPDLLHVRRWNVQSPTWPKDAPELRILTIADPHPGAPHIDEAKIERVVAMANAERPDIVILMGDYIAGGLFTRFVPPETTARLFSSLKAPLGVYTILGNHDWWLDGGRVARAFEAEGIAVLENKSIALKWRGGDIWLAGIGDKTTGHDRPDMALANIPDHAPLIVAMHHPDSYPELPRRAGLALTGHTHGGQVNLPLLGRLVVPSIYGQRYAYGLIDGDLGPLVVSGGIGTSIIPVRFGTIPEITLITLKAAPPR
ncbi:Predicted phosphohydrolase [Rhodospirillaceae bacterium LM-1]|nr:Predicted phosphohydrolase [Rhodospirillaceae bacterium LM-1]